MQLDSSSYRYETSQVLLTVVLGFVHFAFYLLAFYLIIVLGPLFTLFVIAIGALEITAGRKISAALGVLKLWLVGVGALTIAFSVLCLVYILSQLD